MKAARVLALATVALTVALGLPDQAQATPIGAGTSDFTIAWDGPTTSLSWQGDAYAVATASFLGSAVAVPGDQVQRTAIIANAGPSAATVRVELVDLTESNPAANPGLTELIHLYWDVNGQVGDQTWQDASATQSASGAVAVASFDLAQGANFPVTVGFYFPIEATTGEDGGATPNVLSFGLRVTMTGDTGDDPGPGGPIWVDTGGWTTSGRLGAVAIVGLVLGLAALVAAKLARRRASVAQR